MQSALLEGVNKWFASASVPAEILTHWLWWLLLLNSWSHFRYFDKQQGHYYWCGSEGTDSSCVRLNKSSLECLSPTWHQLFYCYIPSPVSSSSWIHRQEVFRFVQKDDVLQLVSARPIAQCFNSHFWLMTIECVKHQKYSTFTSPKPNWGRIWRELNWLKISWIQFAVSCI